MPGIIHRLPEHIANQIAAGEVVQRPASAVKELMENAVDSGATQIDVFIEDAGKRLIRVVDNGCGMNAEDASLCFERHATSKIKGIEDLFAIRTRGFRGEALPSMAAVSRVELKTRLHDSELGMSIGIEHSEIQSADICQTAAGTSVALYDLFYNIPARRNFLKTNAVEMRHIVDEFQRVAISQPEIGFRLNHNGVELFNLRTSGLRPRIVAVLGKQYNERLVPIEESTSILNINGFVGKPEYARKSRGEQFFFVNGRYIRSSYLHHAVASLYKELIPEKYHPLYVLFLELDPSRVDVNVHPAKQEVKFEDEKIIYTFIKAAVRHALARFSVTPTLDFSQDTGIANLEAFRRPGKKSQMPGWEKLFEGLPDKKPRETLTIESDFSDSPSVAPDSQKATSPEVGMAPFQIHRRYIMSQIKSGIILVDQQAAHRRILFEKYLNSLESAPVSSQKQLFPQTIELSKADAVLLKEIAPDINALGFDLQEFGESCFVLHGIPSEFEDLPAQQAIEELMGRYRNNQTGLNLQGRENLARSLAATYSIKYGVELGNNEMRRLIDELFACKTPYIAPNGKPTLISLSLEELAERFGN